MSVNKEEFLNQHIDNIQGQIWLLEIDKMIIEGGVKQATNKEMIDSFMLLLNGDAKKPGLINQIKGLEQRIQFIRKVIHGTTSVDNPAPADQPTHTIRE